MVSAGAVRCRSSPPRGCSRWTRRWRRAARAVRHAGQQRRRAGGATARSRGGHGGPLRSGARPRAGTEPGSSPGPPHPAAAPSKSLNEWSPFPPWPRSQPGGLDSTTGWTSCTSSPLRSTAARSRTGTWPQSPRLSTTSSGLSYVDAAIPRASRRHHHCRGGDTGVTPGGSRLERRFLLSPRPGCHQSPRFGAF
jgi:hypothetical protein